MWTAERWKEYEIADASSGEKLERWGKYMLVRPDPQVIWNTIRTDKRWDNPDARYERSSTGGGHWALNKLPDSFSISYGKLRFNLKPMNFKHTGLFPEQAVNWDWFSEIIKSSDLIGFGRNTSNSFEEILPLKSGVYKIIFMDLN